jgi:hypothetical protein
VFEPFYTLRSFDVTEKFVDAPATPSFDPEYWIEAAIGVSD